jgi:DNA repair exonuclease SbcCD nuclease subunit
MAVSFIHTADWQIGRAFDSIGGDAAALLRSQRIKTVQRIAQEAAARNVEAVLVAGDVFENNLVGNETVHGVLHAMESFKGDWVLIPGNHDPGIDLALRMRIS